MDPRPEVCPRGFWPLPSPMFHKNKNKNRYKTVPDPRAGSCGAEIANVEFLLRKGYVCLPFFTNKHENRALLI